MREGAHAGRFGRARVNVGQVRAEAQRDGDFVSVELETAEGLVSYPLTRQGACALASMILAAANDRKAELVCVAYYELREAP